jgi:Zn-dependent protease
MDIFNTGIPLGRYFGINVRLDITFFIAFCFWMDFQNPALSVALIGGLYFCVLLHEFGHALMSRWCDGEANDIVLWPFGGVAFCRPAWHPTAHLLTAAAGPLVTLVIALALTVLSVVLNRLPVPVFVSYVTAGLAYLNWKILLFNLIPAFPMDGGRVLRDTLWYWLGVEKATLIAVWISRCIAAVGILWAIYRQDYWFIFLAFFILLQSQREYRMLAYESAGAQCGFSIRERFRRGRRQRAYHEAVAVRRNEQGTAFHRCTSCGRTEQDDRHLDFRICTDCSGGQEYCRDHLDSHPHI